ncbi:MAG: hypothetical protein NT114_00615 [Patescibacteria group bacterium]|nr:hypothetical protein [Patescibacteria group bacterium]
MANIAPIKKSKSIGSKGLSKGFKFRWWMAVVIIASVAIVGILVLRFSKASVIPPEELAKIQSGIIIETSVTGVNIKYPPYSYERSFNAAESLKASQDPNEYDRLNALILADLEKIYIKNNPGAGQSTAPATTAKPATPADTSTDPASSDATSTDPAASDTTVGSETKTDNGSTSDETKDLGQISGYTKFVYDPSNKDDIKSLNLLIDNKIVKIVKKPPFEFSLDSLAYSNGQHKMQLVITKKDNTQSDNNYSVEIKNSSLFSRILYYIGLPWTVVLPN